MKNLIFKIAVLTGTVAAFASCSDTWLMYDTSQKDKLYFKYENYPSLDQYLSTDFSFALLDESVKEVNTCLNSSVSTPSVLDNWNIKM